MNRPVCIFCGLTVRGQRVPVGRRFRHPECERAARDHLPERPLTPGEAEEFQLDAEKVRGSHEPPRK